MTPTFQNSNSPETILAFFAGTVLTGWMVWLGLKRISSGPRTPDPWGAEISAAVNEDSAIPLCPHCLEPHDELEHFCAKCGGPVGQYTNLMPPLYYISLGHVMRIGTSGNFKVSPFLIFGYFVTGIPAFALIAPLALCLPIYWFLLFSNIGRLCRYDPSPEPDIVEAGDADGTGPTN